LRRLTNLLSNSTDSPPIANPKTLLLSPLLRLVPYDMVMAKAYDNLHPHTTSMSLAEDWPWWSVPEYDLVKPEIQADPRWKEWVAKLQP